MFKNPPRELQFDQSASNLPYNPPMDISDRFQGCLLGLAVGDAVGTSVEFQPRGSFPPLTGMAGGGPFGLDPGAWTDDTSMALCLATSLVECGGFDPADQMARYIKWWQEGYLSSTGTCFDIGFTVRTALERYRRAGEPFSGSTDPNSAGNGSLMRLAPVPMYYYSDLENVSHYSAESSRTTHGAQECVDACRYFGLALFRALRGDTKEQVLGGWDGPGALSPKIAAVADGVYRGKAESAIRGSGYVVASLEAALWCFHHTDSYEAAVLAAANLGDDADTTAAICGQVAGAFYGRSGIPESWLEVLVMREKIEALAKRLMRAG